MGELGNEPEVDVGASRTGSFVAGADRRAFADPTPEPRLPVLIPTLEASEKPVVAMRVRGRNSVATG